MWRVGGYGGDEFPAPTYIEADAKKAVEEVVGGSEFAEEVADALGVIRRGVPVAGVGAGVAGAGGVVVVKVRASLLAPTTTRSPALIFPRMISSAMGSSRNLSIARRRGRAP